MSQQVKKYRLIKLYPGSPILNSEYIEIVGLYSGGKRMYKHSISAGMSISANEIENHPEYWEEIIEYPIGTKAYNSKTHNTFIKQKDGWYIDNKTAYTDRMIRDKKWINIVEEEVIEKEYEILSFKHRGSKHIWKKDLQLKDTFCIINGKAPFTSLEEINKYPKVYEIYSVKRLSDGVVFTIGDNVIHTNNVTYRTGKVTNLHIVSDCIFITTNDRIKGFDTNLCFVEKLKKQPLFTSTDGFEMFADDKYYVAQTSGNNLIGSLIEFIVDKQILHNPEYYGKYPNIKRFAKEENCKQYIADNMRKPLFTTEDGVEIYNLDTVYYIRKLWISYKDSYIYSTTATKGSTQTTHLYFSTKAKAEEYILYNKPCLSLNDVATVYVTANQRINIGTPQNAQVRKIKQLVKSKL